MAAGSGDEEPERQLMACDRKAELASRLCAMLDEIQATIAEALRLLEDARALQAKASTLRRRADDLYEALQRSDDD